MLGHLHEDVSKVVLIDGVSQDADGAITVQYADEPTPEQLIQVTTLIEDWPVELARLEEEAKVDKSVQAIEEQGYDTKRGYRIGLDSKSASDLTGAVVLAKEAILQGYEGNHFILDSEGVTQSVTYEELIETSLEYGAARNALYIVASEKTLMIRAAKTIDEVKSIDTEIEV